MLVLVILFGLIPLVSDTLADTDRYKGDTAIYSATSTEMRPNVLFLIDTSQDMGQAGGGDAYDPSIIYPSQGFDTYAIYKKVNQTTYQLYVADVYAAGVCAAAKDLFVGKTGSIGPPEILSIPAVGFYSQALVKTTGECSVKATEIGDYYLGNLLNKITAPVVAASVWTGNHVYALGEVVKPTSTSFTTTYRCVQAGTSGNTEPTWPTVAGTTVNDGTVRWEITADLLEVVKQVLYQVSEPLREKVKFGVMTFGTNNHGGYLRAGVKAMSPAAVDGDTNYAAFKTAVADMDFLATNTGQPVNETLWDAQLYFQGKNDSTLKFSTNTSAAPSPIEYSCQKNFVILLTTGSSTPSPQAAGAIGNLDGDLSIGSVMDAAKRLYETDALPDTVGVDKSQGIQRIQTTVVQLMTSENPELRAATNGTHGRGAYYNPKTTNELIAALLDTLANNVRETETAFVAPVVPASPENRTYSGKRIYIGFFKPVSGGPWLGNLKKFAINSQNQIVSTDETTPATNADGSFNAGATSFWSPEGDSGNVLEGGIGEALKTRTTERKIYTYTGDSTKKILTDPVNAFVTTNLATPLSAGNLGVIATDRSKLINYVRGFDGYNDNGLGVTEKRSWLLGDILHSKPLVLPFKKYTFTTANESNPDVNKTYIFQGTNDGMLHAFRDCDGSESWAFIPPDLLPRLKNLRETSHSYYVDTTASIYQHDANGDGNIVKTDGDRAILLFGLRRGGGTNLLSATVNYGTFYALDVTDPEAPEFLWQINNQTPGFSELAETWSQPKLFRFKVGSVRKIAMVVGAGYDNAEDLRFGNTQTYPDDTSATNPTADFTTGMSLGTNITPQYPRGRGLYVIEIAALTGSPLAPDFTHTGEKIWSYTYGSVSSTTVTGTATSRTSPQMAFSVASDIFVLDRDQDGNADKIYMGDVGGNLWRFEVGNTDPANWDGKIIFKSNPGADTTKGRKIFFKPDVTFLDSNNSMVYFGTGDREHPQNYKEAGQVGGAVVDRFYAFRDNYMSSTVLTEANMVDVTENILQQEEDPTLVADERARLADPTKYGWYIKLNAPNHLGEKILAPASVYNGVAFFTTYQPHTVEALDIIANPCKPGNLGYSRMYAVNSMTGESVYNYNAGTGTDIFGENQGSSANKNAQGTDANGNAYVLRRSDRELSLGGGIPSGMVFIMGANGKVTLLTSADASFPALQLEGCGVIFPVYWYQR
jgi:type IV pilus assembly protein PilY1